MSHAAVRFQGVRNPHDLLEFGGAQIHTFHEPDLGMSRMSLGQFSPFPVRQDLFQLGVQLHLQSPHGLLPLRRAPELGLRHFLSPSLIGLESLQDPPSHVLREKTQFVVVPARGSVRGTVTRGKSGKEPRQQILLLRLQCFRFSLKIL
jgi:hypothetical protein